MKETNKKYLWIGIWILILSSIHLLEYRENGRSPITVTDSLTFTMSWSPIWLKSTIPKYHAIDTVIETILQNIIYYNNNSNNVQNKGKESKNSCQKLKRNFACPPWSLQFLVIVFTFLSLILSYSYFGTFLSAWSMWNVFI